MEDSGFVIKRFVNQAFQTPCLQVENNVENNECLNKGKLQNGKDVFISVHFCEDDCDHSNSSHPGSFTQVSLQDNTSQASKNRKTIWMAEGRNKSVPCVKGLALKWLS